MNGKNDLVVEVNYSDEVKECKILKLTFPNGEQSFVKKEHLMSFLFVIGSSEEQRDLVPEKIRHTKWYQTTISVKSKKDIHKGEQIVFPIKISLPATEEEVIRRKGDLFIPKGRSIIK